MQEELNKFERNNVWKLVEKLENYPIIRKKIGLIYTDIQNNLAIHLVLRFTRMHVKARILSKYREEECSTIS